MTRTAMKLFDDFAAIAMVFLYVSVYIPYYYIPDYTLDNGMDAKASLYVLSIMNAASILGRILTNWMADK